jgi:hypothetical protein
LAVSHGFGGIDSESKAEWMVFAVDQWFAENGDSLKNSLLNLNILLGGCIVIEMLV